MKNPNLIAACFLLIFAGVLACRKEVTTGANASDDKAAGQLNAINLVASPCDAFVYSDTIFYPSSSTSYIIKPATTQAGTYGAFPTGLAINTLNGSINISKSETGLEYMVWFIPKGTTDTCIKYLTVSGVNYNDSIYVMASGTANGNPIYNANPLLPIECNGGCEFDAATDATQRLIPKGFAINKSTGVIDFKKSIQNGVLGKNPKNGVSRVFTLYYRLGDKSAKALNKISFELFYYKTQALIPAKLKEDVLDKQGQVLLEGEEEDEGGHHGGHSGSGGGSGSGGSGNGDRIAVSISSNASAKNGQGEVKCRPPYIIVTQQ